MVRISRVQSLATDLSLNGIVDHPALSRISFDETTRVRRSGRSSATLQRWSVLEADNLSYFEVPRARFDIELSTEIRLPTVSQTLFESEQVEVFLSIAADDHFQAGVLDDLNGMIYFYWDDRDFVVNSRKPEQDVEFRRMVREGLDQRGIVYRLEDIPAT